jgi:hypothetical protein
MLLRAGFHLADKVLLHTKTNVPVIVEPSKKNGLYKFIMNRTASRINFHCMQALIFTWCKSFDLAFIPAPSLFFGMYTA